VSPKPLARFLRLRVLPLALPFALRASVFRRLAFRTVSQTRIHYRKGPLAQGRRGGDRFPPRPGDGVGWRLVGVVGEEAEAWCRKLGIDFAVGEEGARLIRPDGYVGLAAGRFEAAAFDRYLRDRIGRPL
jgi:hypothetical protein